MSAPPSGSSGSPVPGYYPDPSIPNYIRYWNGSAWVPGTSRPAPIAADPPPPAVELPPAAALPPAAVPPPVVAPPVVAPPVVAPPPRPGAVDESGPMFLDEDPSAPRAQPGPAVTADPRGAWPEVAPPAAQRPPVTWGLPSAPEAAPGRGGARAPLPIPAPDPAPPALSPVLPVRPHAGAGAPGHAGRDAGRGAPEQGPVRRPDGSDASGGAGAPGVPRGPGTPGGPRAAGAGVPAQGPAGSQPGPAGGAPANGPAGASAGDWAAQVRELARGEGSGPWRPVAEDPFASARRDDRPGGLVRRFAARIIDFVLLLAVTGAAAVPLGTSAYHHAKDKVDQARLTGETVKVWLLDGTTGADLGAVVAVLLLAGLLLEVLPTAKWGRTLGKKLVGLRVLDIEGQLPPRFGASLRRWLARMLLDMTVVGTLGTAWGVFDRPWKQGLHDKAARTFVAGV